MVRPCVGGGRGLALNRSCRFGVVQGEVVTRQKAPTENHVKGSASLRGNIFNPACGDFHLDLAQRQIAHGQSFQPSTLQGQAPTVQPRHAGRRVDFQVQSQTLCHPFRNPHRSRATRIDQRTRRLAIDQYLHKHQPIVRQLNCNGIGDGRRRDDCYRLGQAIAQHCQTCKNRRWPIQVHVWMVVPQRRRPSFIGSAPRWHAARPPRLQDLASGALCAAA